MEDSIFMDRKVKTFFILDKGDISMMDKKDKKEIPKYQEFLDGLQGILYENDKMIRDLKNQNEMLIEEVCVCKSKIEYMHKEIDAQTEKLKELNIVLEKKDHMVDSLCVDNKILHEENDHLKQKLKSLAKELTDFKN